MPVVLTARWKSGGVLIPEPVTVTQRSGETIDELMDRLKEEIRDAAETYPIDPEQ